MSERLLEPARGWLTLQPGMRPWQKGCAKIRECLDQWIDQYVPAVADEASALPDSTRELYRASLWHCWSYHWEQHAQACGPIDGAVVANRIQKGGGLLGKGRLGGNVLEDIVLTRALLQGQKKALDEFEERFQSNAIATAWKRAPAVADSPDFWSDLLEHLGGFSGQRAARLQGFSGRSGLANWLPRVVINFTLDRTASSHSMSVPETQPAKDTGPLDGLMTADCLQRIAALLQSAAKQVSPREQVALRLRYAEGVENRDIARALGIHPGTASRFNQTALEKIRQLLTKPDGLDETDQQMRQECLHHLLQGSGARNLGALLWDALFDNNEGDKHDT